MSLPSKRHEEARLPREHKDKPAGSFWENVQESNATKIELLRQNKKNMFGVGAEWYSYQKTPFPLRSS